MANKGTPGAKGASKHLPLKTLLEIKRNRYRLENTSTGVIQDYVKEEIDQAINEKMEKRAEEFEEQEEKHNRKIALFQNKEAMQMLSAHTNEIEKLEEQKALKLIRQYRAIRNNLRDRLDQVEQDTFTAQQMRGVLMQIDYALLEMQGRLNDGMKDAVNDVSMKGIEHLFDEYTKFNEIFTGAVHEIDVDKVAIVQDTENLLFNRYSASLRAYTEDLRARLAMGLTQAIIEEIGYPRVVKNLSSFFLGEEWRLHRIVRTELSNVYNLSKQNTMTELVESGQTPKLKKTLFNPMDARTAEDSKHVEKMHLVVDIDKPFVYTYNGKKFKGMTPPFRPNDRAVMIPYSEDWG